MALTALRGAVGFLSRAPVGRDEAAWAAFRQTPAAIPAAGYLVGVAVALPLLAPVPPLTAGAGFVAAVYLVTGPTHADGLADVGDAAATHGDPDERRAVMRDASVGAGGALALAVAVLALWAGGVALAGLPARAALVVVAAEVGAKTGVATLVALGPASHEGTGAALVDAADRRSLVPVGLVAAPAAVLWWPAVVAAVVAALVVRAWACRMLGGVSGDVLGAANELARVAALHAGVVVWTHS